MNPESKSDLRNRQAEWLKPAFHVVLISSVLFGAAILIAPHFIRQRIHDPWQRGHSNARQLGLALFEFENDYGSFPSDLTSRKVSESIPTHGYDLTGTSSNALLRQIYAAGISQSESMLDAGISNSMKPDGNITPGHLLEPGECRFSYISGLSNRSDPATPIVLAPLIPDTKKFDPEPFDGKAIVLFVGNNVRIFDIEEDGHIYDKGINLLSPKHPVWKGKAPDIRYPE